MAKNLQKKLAATDTIRVFDVNEASMSKLVAEVRSAPGGAAVEVSADAFGAAKESVRLPFPISSARVLSSTLPVRTEAGAALELRSALPSGRALSKAPRGLRC